MRAVIRTDWLDGIRSVVKLLLSGELWGEVGIGSSYYKALRINTL